MTTYPAFQDWEFCNDGEDMQWPMPLSQNGENDTIQETLIVIDLTEEDDGYQYYFEGENLENGYQWQTAPVDGFDTALAAFEAGITSHKNHLEKETFL